MSKRKEDSQRAKPSLKDVGEWIAARERVTRLKDLLVRAKAEEREIASRFKRGPGRPPVPKPKLQPKRKPGRPPTLSRRECEWYMVMVENYKATGTEKSPGGFKTFTDAVKAMATEDYKLDRPANVTLHAFVKAKKKLFFQCRKKFAKREKN